MTTWHNDNDIDNDRRLGLTAAANQPDYNTTKLKFNRELNKICKIKTSSVSF